MSDLSIERDARKLSTLISVEDDKGELFGGGVKWVMNLDGFSTRKQKIQFYRIGSKRIDANV